MDKSTSDRDNAIKWARGLFAHGEFVIFDTETTGLSSKAEILQFAFLSPDSILTIEFDVCPSKNAELNEGAFRTHGISLESAQGLSPITIWADNIIASIKGKTVIAWNASFDYRMLIQSFAAHGVEPPVIIHLANFECAMLQYAKFFGDFDSNRGQYRWQKLPGATHGALEDCRATLAVLQLMASARLSDEPETTLPAVAVDDGRDPAANGYTFNTFGEIADAIPFAGDPVIDSIRDLVVLVGEFVTVEAVAVWSMDQRTEAIKWAADTAVANIERLMGQFYVLPSRPSFFPPIPGESDGIPF